MIKKVRCGSHCVRKRGSRVGVGLLVRYGQQGSVQDGGTIVTSLETFPPFLFFQSFIFISLIGASSLQGQYISAKSVPIDQEQDTS